MCTSWCTSCIYTCIHSVAALTVPRVPFLPLVSPRNLFNIYKTYLISGVGALGDFTETVLLSPVTPVEVNDGNGGLKAWGEWIKKYDISEEVKVLA